MSVEFAAEPRHAARGGAPAGGRSVLAALDVIECLASSGPLGVTDVARQLGMAKSTSYRLLITLCQRGIAEQDPDTGRYQLGPHLYDLAERALTRMPLHCAALPALERLRLQTSQTAHVSIADGANVVYIDRLSTARGAAVLEGHSRRMPVHATSSGKALAAFDPGVDERRRSAGFPALTHNTITSLAEWDRTLQRVRQHGYAVSDGECIAQVASVAAPVRDGLGRARAAISVTGPAADILPYADRLAHAVRAAARAVAARAFG